MQLIRPPKLILIGEGELPELVAECVKKISVQNINSIFVVKL
jgi:hypothetical protein